jgi:hypothetical protein
VILAVAGLARLYIRKRRTSSAEIRQRFGPEYERVRTHGSERRAEAELVDREKRVMTAQGSHLHDPEHHFDRRVPPA